MCLAGGADQEERGSMADEDIHRMIDTPAARQAALYERTDGREGNTMKGLPIVVVTNTGARTGAVHKTPVMRVEHNGRYAVVASKGGAPQHPRWYHNLVKHPEVQLQDGPHRRTYLAHEASGAEREEWWARAVQAFPDYAAYQKRTERQIPVFVLVPTSDD